MASKKKTTVLTENENLGEDSAAMSSLAPNSKPTNNPESRYETLSKMIGSALTLRDEELTKWYNEMIAQIGHEADKIPDGNAAHNADTIKMKEEADAALKTAIQEDLLKIFEGDTTLSEEFKAKSGTLFEAAVSARVNLEISRLEEEYAETLEEELNEAVGELAEQLEAYLDYAAADWIIENEVAIESALRNELTGDVMAGIRNVFIENNINIPESEVDVVDELAATVEELETRLGEMIEENAMMKESIEDLLKKEAFEEISEGLTVVQREKLRELSESVDADDLESFKSKLGVIKESSFVKSPTGRMTINEQLEEIDEDNNNNVQKTFTSPQMRSYVEAIKRTAVK